MSPFLSSAFIDLPSATIFASMKWGAQAISDAGFSERAFETILKYRVALARRAAKDWRINRNMPSRKRPLYTFTEQDEQVLAAEPSGLDQFKRTPELREIPRNAWAKLRDALATANLHAGLFSEKSGRVSAIPAHYWMSEDADLSHQLGRVAIAYPGAWSAVEGIPVLSRDEFFGFLEGQILAPAEQSEKGNETSSAAQPEPSPQNLEYDEPRSAGGSPPKYDWDAIWGEIVRKVHDDGLPVTNAELISHVQDWCVERYGKHPSPQTLKPKIAAVFKAMRRTARG